MLVFITGCVIFILDVIAVGHILLSVKGESDRAAMWLFCIFAMPGAGLILYVFWGMSRRTSYAARIDHLKKAMAGTKNPKLTATLDALNRANAKFLMPERVCEREKTFDYRVILDRIFSEYPPLTGNSIDLLCDGDDAYPAMLDAIENAKKNINMQSFIIADDEAGKAIFEALSRKAAENVDVKVIYDSFGSFSSMTSHFFYRYARKNPHLKIRAFSHLSLMTPWNMQLRNHRKLLVVDGKTAFIGGMNISADNFRLVGKRRNAIHDLHCRIKGPAVSELQINFLSDWCFTSKESPENIFTQDYFPPPAAAGNNCVRVIPSGNGSCDYGSEQCFYAACASARRSLWIYTPYFVPDKPFINALQTTATRGVDVRIIVPANNNHFFMRMASKSLYPELLAHGVRIFERKGNFSHAKAMLVDSEWTLFGSSNCDVRSFRLNYELDITVSNGDFIQLLYNQLLCELAESEEVTDVDASHKVRLMRNICALFTPIL